MVVRLRQTNVDAPPLSSRRVSRDRVVQSATVRRIIAAAVALVLVAAEVAAATPASTTTRRRRGRRAPMPPPLVWHVETLAGDVVSSNKGDEAINPASVVKAATSMWAIDRLGPDYRFETRLFARGAIDPKTQTLRGDLVVIGSGDPDFQAENAFLVAEALNRVGIRQVRGNLIVNRKFWMGWENGSQGTNPDPVQRGLTMAARLRQALDPRRWNRAVRGDWRRFAVGRGLSINRPFRVQFVGGIGADGEAEVGQLLVVHRSEPLATALRRFNCYSNNDIERVGSFIGAPQELAAEVAARCATPASHVQLETTSGLGTNRLSPRTIVRMMREFKGAAARAGVAIETLLPVGGCDPGTVTGFFPQLASGPNAGSVVGKTGTLTSTDGGVSVLAGFVSTGQGEYVFCVAAPRAEGRLRVSRGAEERWVLAFMDEHGGPRSRTCGAPLQGPDEGAEIVLMAGQ
jgi:D-alanyl-D-alanine carboxypeptidase/D-alanyl-D-alanine-endopeptidase (penicillin-binding protein 4)